MWTESSGQNIRRLIWSMMSFFLVCVCAYMILRARFSWSVGRTKTIITYLHVRIPDGLLDVGGSHSFLHESVPSCSVWAYHSLTLQSQGSHDVINTHLTACRWLLRCCWSDYDHDIRWCCWSHFIENCFVYREHEHDICNTADRWKGLHEVIWRWDDVIASTSTSKPIFKKKTGWNWFNTKNGCFACRSTSEHPVHG